MRASQVLVCILTFTLATTALAGFASRDSFLPSVGRGPGAAGSQWYTTIWVFNPGAATATVTFVFLARNQTNPSSTITYSDTVAPGVTKRYENAVQLMFSLTNNFGAIRVTSDTAVVVSARIYSQPAGGEDRDTVGQYFGAVPAEFAIVAGETAHLVGVYQTTPAASSQFRYNFGFVETAGGTSRSG